MAYSLDVIVKLQTKHGDLYWHIHISKEREKRWMRDICVSLYDLTIWIMLALNYLPQSSSYILELIVIIGNLF